MKVRAIEAKIREITKRMNEAKQKLNRKSVENYELLQQIYYFKQKINALKNNENNVIL